MACPALVAAVPKGAARDPGDTPEGENAGGNADPALPNPDPARGDILLPPPNPDVGAALKGEPLEPETGVGENKPDWFKTRSFRFRRSLTSTSVKWLMSSAPGGPPGRGEVGKEGRCRREAMVCVFVTVL